jgi:hypothetical protein
MSFSVANALSRILYLYGEELLWKLWKEGASTTWEEFWSKYDTETAFKVGVPRAP